MRDRRYLASWLGQVTSAVGNQLTVVVLAALVVPDRGPGTFGLVLAVESAVMAVLLLAGAVVADRYSRSFVMAIADLRRRVEDRAVSGHRPSSCCWCPPAGHSPSPERPGSSPVPGPAGPGGHRSPTGAVRHTSP
ncbi:hypothetical protein ABWJ92_16895 [Streptomyces sp. NPDC000609]|uniref:hypothetical protein n=1 Tax=Streptomyces sp. NPDC000609 TaxID=3160957 RepID=UPI0033992ED2